MVRKFDYRRYKIKPGNGWSWTKAVQYMLQSPENIVGLRGEHSTFLFRICDGVIEYRCDNWTKDLYPAWGNAAGHNFNTRLCSGFFAYEMPEQQREPSCCDYPIHMSRLDRIEMQLERLLGQQPASDNNEGE